MCFPMIIVLPAQLSACSCFVFRLPMFLILKLLLRVLCEKLFIFMLWSEITKCILGWRMIRRWDVHPQSYPSVLLNLLWSEPAQIRQMWQFSLSFTQYNWHQAHWIADVQLLNIDRARPWFLTAIINNTTRSLAGTKKWSDCSAPTFNTMFELALDKRFR